MDIHLKNIFKKYPRAEAPALEMADLLIRGGETHGILGHSGSGKSTMLNLLALLDRPNADTGKDAELIFYPEGQARPGYRWAGKKSEAPQGVTNIQNENKWRRQHYSFVFQSGYLLGNIPVLDNVLMPLRLRGKTSGKNEQTAKILLERMGITSDKWGRLPHQISGGEYQRVAVARSVVHSPSVVFADEPTGSLDPEKGEVAMNTLKTWLTDKSDCKSKLLVLVTHNLSHVMKYCDSVTVLRGGRKVLHGKTRDHTEQTIGRAMTQ